MESARFIIDCKVICLVSIYKAMLVYFTIFMNLCCLLKRAWRSERKALPCDGVVEREALGMEVESVGRVAVESVAFYRTCQPFAVGTVHTELVGASRQWRQQHTSVGKRLVVGDGPATVLVVDNLIGTVCHVGPQGEADANAPPHNQGGGG